MTRKISIIATDIARRDLDNIREYIQIESPRSANFLIKSFYDRLSKLKSFPKLGRIIPEIGDPSLREIVVDPYRLMYRLEGRKIVILRVLHGKRLFEGEL